MPDHILYTLPASDITIVGASALGHPDHGEALHLMGATITLNTTTWLPITVTDSDASFEDNDPSQTLTHTTLYDGATFNAGWRVEGEYQITVETPDGTQYTLIGFNINEPGVTSFSTVEGLAFVDPAGSVPNSGGFPPAHTPLTVVSVSEGPAGMATPYAAYATPACFTPGTVIDTEEGPRKIEDIDVGARVWTGEAGLQPLRWKGATTYSAAALARRPDLRPVRIARGAFGPDCPAQDLVVSPQHRVLIEGWMAELFYGKPRVFVAAKHLINGHDVTRAVPSLTPVTYIHLAFDSHYTLRSNGVSSESFLPSPAALQSFNAADRAALYALFPDLEQRFRCSCHPSLTAREARLVAA